MKWIFGLVFLLSNFLFSQNLDYNNGYESVRICTAIQGNNFVSEKSADETLTKILSVIGASKRFVLQECSNINNAVALTFNGVRYIMYDPEFMSELKYSSDWTNMFILAHEVGHHINGHSVDVILSSNGMGEETSLSTKRIQELEADEFAGFVLGRLGATLSQTQSVMKTISSDGDDSYSTHPSRSKRLNAIKRGFENSGGYVDSSNLDIKKGKTVESPYSNLVYSGVKHNKISFGGGTYIGYVDINTNKPFGFGTWKKNGYTYEGEWLDSDRDGYGKEIMASGDTYEGYFVQDERNGDAVYTFEDGTKWIGTFSKGKFVRGSKRYVSGYTYEGIFYGSESIDVKVTKPNGEIYNVGFLDGSNGNGLTTYHGISYELKGYFLDGKLKPQIGLGYVGITSYQKIYNGEWYNSSSKTIKKEHKKKNIAKFTDFLPLEILQSFENYIEPKPKGIIFDNYKSDENKEIWNLEKGISKIILANVTYTSEEYNKFYYSGFNYEGTILTIGEWIYGDSYHYKGYFLYDSNLFCGYGELTDDGTNYKGMFWNDKYNGYGILTKSDGKVQKGLFKNGEFVKNEDFDFEWMERTMKRW